MSKKYKILVSNTVIVPVEGKLTDAAGKPVPFKFTLTCKRSDQAQMKEQFDGKSLVFADFMQEVTTNWAGQRLVMEEDGETPAEFCADALSAMLNINGMGLICFNAYNAENGAKAKN
jgi:hypothetical protein